MRRFNFPGGEVHVIFDDLVEDFYGLSRERFNLWSSDDIMAMLQCIAINPLEQIQIPYVPYARQDRKTSRGEALSIKIMADIINSLNAKSVVIWDPHSEVTPALINNCAVIHQHELIQEAYNQHKMSPKYTGVIAPDAGAAKKAYQVAKVLNCKVYQAGKVRNIATGEITDTVMYDILPEGGTFLVVDDICDGGKTFTELAKIVDPYASQLDLYVTHGIFSKGLNELHSYYEHIYCANSKNDLENTSHFTVLFPKDYRF